GFVQPRSGAPQVVTPRSFGRRSLFFRPVPFHDHLRFHILFGNSCLVDPFIDPFFCRRFLFPNQFFFSQSVFLPYPVYAGPSYPVAEQAPSTIAEREGDLAREIERLTDEVERLRKDDASREQARQPLQPPRSPAEENTTNTILVFRDGHRSEVRS